MCFILIFSLYSSQLFNILLVENQFRVNWINTVESEENFDWSIEIRLFILNAILEKWREKNWRAMEKFTFSAEYIQQNGKHAYDKWWQLLFSHKIRQKPKSEKIKVRTNTKAQAFHCIGHQTE